MRLAFIDTEQFSRFATKPYVEVREILAGMIWAAVGFSSLSLTLVSLVGYCIYETSFFVIAIYVTLTFGLFCTWRFAGTIGRPNKPAEISPQEDRLDIDSWLDFLSEVLSLFGGSTRLISAGERMLDDSEIEQVEAWDYEAIIGPSRATAQAFLDKIKVTFADYLRFCRQNELQPLD